MDKTMRVSPTGTAYATHVSHRLAPLCAAQILLSLAMLPMLGMIADMNWDDIRIRVMPVWGDPTSSW